MINRATHDMFIKVNKEGMAGTTIVVIKRKMVPIREIRVNRPFLFLVFDKVTKLVFGLVLVSKLENNIKIQKRI